MAGQAVLLACATKNSKLALSVRCLNNPRPLLRLKASGQRESHSVTRVATERNRFGAMLKDKVMTWATLFR